MTGLEPATDGLEPEHGGVDIESGIQRPQSEINMVNHIRQNYVTTLREIANSQYLKS